MDRWRYSHEVPGECLQISWLLQTCFYHSCKHLHISVFILFKCSSSQINRKIGEKGTWNECKRTHNTPCHSATKVRVKFKCVGRECVTPTLRSDWIGEARSARLSASGRGRVLLFRLLRFTSSLLWSNSVEGFESFNESGRSNGSLQGTDLLKSFSKFLPSYRMRQMVISGVLLVFKWSSVDLCLYVGNQQNTIKSCWNKRTKLTACNGFNSKQLMVFVMETIRICSRF